MTPLIGTYNVKCSGQEARLEVAKFLIESGANVNVRAKIDAPTSDDPPKVWGETPLHFAAGYGSAQMVRLLINAGADKRIETAKGETPLAYAQRHKRPKEIHQLLQTQ